MNTKVNIKGMSQGENMIASSLLYMILSHIDHLIEKTQVHDIIYVSTHEQEQGGG